MKIKHLFGMLLLAIGLAGCGSGSGSAGTVLNGASSGSSTSSTSSTDTTSTTTTTTATASTTATDNNAQVVSLLLVPSANTLNADGVSVVNYTISALNSNNALVTNADISLSATGSTILGTSSVNTGTTGTATVALTANPANQTNRTATITATCAGSAASAASSQLQIIGASVVVATSANTVVVGASSAVLSVTVKSAATGAPVMAGIPVNFVPTNSSILAVSAPTVTTGSNGVATVTVSAVSAGTASVNVTALGVIVGQPYTAGVATTSLVFTAPSSNIITTNSATTLVVSAPAGATTVTFATTLGTFANGQNSQAVAVNGGVASAVLTSSQAGVASISAVDNLSDNAALILTVSPPVSSVSAVILNAAQNTIQTSTASNVNSTVLTAQAVYQVGAANQPVANVPIVFSMQGGPGAGEYLAPALAYTNSSGFATATFYAGTKASIANGITVTAAVSGDQSINAKSILTIGGQAMSVVFGPASTVSSQNNNTEYQMAYSVQVSDANNNPVSGAVVTLRLMPVGFSTGQACDPFLAAPSASFATYCSEDANHNGSLDPYEDGARKQVGTMQELLACPSSWTSANDIGTLDGKLTPQNTDGGIVPATVTTDSTGSAQFNLTYLKARAGWVVDQMTATVSANGNQSSSSTLFVLPAATSDVGTGTACLLPPSPFLY